MSFEANELVENIIEKIIIFIDEFRNENLPRPDVQLVSNIYDAIAQDDREYANTYLNGKNVYGILYPTKNGQLTIYVLDTQDVDNLTVTICHELVHFADFLLYSRTTKNLNYRILQDDITFLMWTEFHAALLSYNLYFKLKKEIGTFDSLQFQKYLLNDFSNQILKKNKLKNKNALYI